MIPRIAPRPEEAAWEAETKKEVSSIFLPRKEADEDSQAR
jgi:hypothetical protein